MPPIYDYSCLNENCKHEFEQQYSSFKAADEAKSELTCPKCGSKEIEKQFPKSTSFQLSGKGWAKDRYE